MSQKFTWLNQIPKEDLYLLWVLTLPSIVSPDLLAVGNVPQEQWERLEAIAEELSLQVLVNTEPKK